jgi:hypothetical protein
MSIKEELHDLLENHERLCRTLADQLPGEAAAGSLKEKLLKMADQAADVKTKLSTQWLDAEAVKKLEEVLL